MDSLHEYLPVLVSEYERGTLVPFVGAGVSQPNCVLWKEFIANLERESGLPFISENAEASTAKLVQRAERAVRRIRNAPDLDLVEIIKIALRSDPRCSEPPPAVVALARIPWPLIITTNYDDWLLSEINRPKDGRMKDSFDRMLVCGRGRADSERIINSLRSPDQPLLWAIQGFVGGQSGDRETEDFEGLDELKTQLVVGHEEYRREAYRSIGFRRAFSEVFRHRSLLFMGSGLTESYFENLFDETLELQGAIGHCHYAFVEKGRLDINALRTRFQIEAIEYPEGKHENVATWIQSLKEAIDHRSVRVAGWSFSLGAKHTIQNGEVSDLQVVRSRLPVPKSGECIVVSAGVRSNGAPALSQSGREALKQCFGVPPGKLAFKLLRRDSRIWQVKGISAFVVAARDNGTSGKDSRDARSVKDAIPAMMDVAAKCGFRRVYSMLLSAGHGRVFPPHVSLLQMARGYASWSHDAASPADRCELVICVVDPRPIALMASGRLNLQEILSVPKTRFWLEIQRHGNQPLVRYLLNEAPLNLLSGVLARFDLGPAGWSAWVIPSPVATKKELMAEEIIGYQGDDPWTVENAGLIPGSTLRVVIASS